tara:strand:- start:102 stop:509 length:408 start_codon:yes stop_codon:yes gene_type:complete
MKEMGRVIASDEKNAEILVMRESACGGHCDKCASSCNQTVTIITKNDAQVSPGEIVEIEAGSSEIVGLAALFYVVPLVFIVLGVVFSNWLFPHGLLGLSSDITAVSSAILFCGLSLLGIKVFTRGHEIDYHIRKV